MSKNRADSFFSDLAEDQKNKYRDYETDQVASDEKITISLRLTAEQHRQAKIKAAKLGVTLSAYIARLIEKDG